MWNLEFKMHFPSKTLQSKLSRLPGYLTVQMVRFFYKEKESVNAKVLKVGLQYPTSPWSKLSLTLNLELNVFFFCFLLWRRMSSSLWCWMSMSCAPQSSRRRCCPSGLSSRRWRTKNLRNNSRRWGRRFFSVFDLLYKNLRFILNNIASVCVF